MSPVDPVSPTSPMDISPITPTTGQFNVPATPMISASLHLPRLVTSFQNTTSNDENLQRMSVQFQLLTPSPLTLGQTPLTAVPRQGSISNHRRTGAVSTPYPRQTPASSVSANASSVFPLWNDLPPGSPAAQRRVPILHRRDAMEGLESMQSEGISPIIERVVQLPVRTTVRRSLTSSLIEPQDLELLPAQSTTSTPTKPRRHRRILPKPSTSQAGPKPRSPISKRTTIRRRYSNSTSLVIRLPTPTPTQALLTASLNHLAATLVPLISVRTGHPHHAFPRTLLAYHLLTHDQLDALARHYHQTLDAGRERWMYPCPIAFGKVWLGSTPVAQRGHLVDLDTKRRRWGRFIGLRGCESPVVEEDGETLLLRMEREWREALRRAEQEEVVRQKLWGRRF